MGQKRSSKGMRDNRKKSKSLSLRARMMITSSILIAISMLSVIIFDYINNNNYSEHLLVKEAQKITETIQHEQTTGCKIMLHLQNILQNLWCLMIQKILKNI